MFRLYEFDCSCRIILGEAVNLDEDNLTIRSTSEVEERLGGTTCGVSDCCNNDMFRSRYIGLDKFFSDSWIWTKLM
jgi:hypothetical protein